MVCACLNWGTKTRHSFECLVGGTHHALFLTEAKLGKNQKKMELRSLESYREPPTRLVVRLPPAVAERFMAARDARCLHEGRPISSSEYLLSLLIWALETGVE